MSAPGMCPSCLIRSSQKDDPRCADCAAFDARMDGQEARDDADGVFKDRHYHFYSRLPRRMDRERRDERESI